MPVEFFSGSGNLSRALAGAGFHLVAVDCAANKRTVAFSPICLNLIDPKDVKVADELIDCLKSEA